tara:strand:+ start:1427 stop:2854 length:1428 start_codon:yes stop_codon:yes gene_type:complete
MSKLSLPSLLMLLLLVVACGDDDSAANAPLAAAVPEGIVVEASGSLEAAAEIAEGQGQLLLNATLGGKPVADKLSVEISAVGGDPAQVTAVTPGTALQLAPGQYSAKFVYLLDEKLGSFDGSAAGLEVRAGQTSRYDLTLTVPVGILVLNFKLKNKQGPPANISSEVKMELFRAEDDPTLVEPVFAGVPGTDLTLAKGKYKVRATYPPGRNRPLVTAWFDEVLVGATLTRTEQEVLIEPEPLGVRVDAYNFSRDINSGTSVFFFSEGADMARAIARAQGVGGKVVEVPSQLAPGKYDVLLLYQPSPMTNPDLKIEKIMLGFEVPAAAEPIRLPVDFETPLGAIRLKVLAGEEDISDRIEMRVMRGGADPNAATPALEEFGVSEHFIPSGTYDVYLKWKKEDGSDGKAEFIRVELGNGHIWEQEFQRDEGPWEARPVRVPPRQLRPITWVDPGDDDDSAGDDDDSAGDDDDSAAGS